MEQSAVPGLVLGLQRDVSLPWSQSVCACNSVGNEGLPIACFFRSANFRRLAGIDLW